MTSKTYIIGIDEDLIVERMGANNTFIYVRTLKSRQEFIEFMVDTQRKGDTAYFSSSVDFPEEYTKNRDTIELARQVRS